MNIINVELPNKYKVNVIEKSRSIIDEIWNKKVYEKDFKIREGMTIIDIGANQGFFSLYAASKGSKIYAIEPEKTNYEILKNNIEINNLQDRIKHFNYAVSSKNGQIELFAQDYELLHASGMVTTSKDYLEKIKKYSNKIYKTKIDCIRFDKFLDSISVNTIDLLKIDCEGAEIDILKSAGKKYFKKINYIVMETHCNYDEKEIFYIVKELGFTITNFKKLEGVNKTGYIFAENNKFNRQSLSYPITILDFNPIIIKDKKHCFDSSKSFSTYNKNTKLEYYWYINDNYIENNKAKFYYTFKNPGKNKISLKICDNNNCSIETKVVTVFEKSYFNKKEFIPLYKSEEHLAINLIGKKNFYINSKYFPIDWIPEYFAIGIRFCNPKNIGGTFLFNNERVELNEVYNEILLSDISTEIDILFSIECDAKREIDITWWPDRIKQNEKKVIIDESEYKKNEAVVLPDKSLDYFCYSNENDKFMIHKDYFPVHWKPKFIVIGISIWSKKKHYEDFEFNGKKESFFDNYKEIKLDSKKINSNIIFTVKTIKKRKLKIVWWAE